MPTTTLKEFRQKYPQYDDLSDQQLGDALHKKYYSDMPREEFDAKIGLAPQQSNRNVQPGIGEDVAKSAASGFARGTADLVGLPGTIADAMRGGMDWVLKRGYQAVTGEEPKFEAGGVERFFADAPPDVAQKLQNPISGDTLRAGLSKVTGGATDYQPKTMPGEYARTIGEFAPAALTGPGTIVQKTAMATVPAMVSETAGQVTEGTAAEPYARVGGALIGGLASARVGQPNIVKQAAKNAPTAESLRQNTDKLYTGMRDLGIKYDANAYGQTVQRIADKLIKKGFRPVGNTKEAFDWVDELMKHVGQSADWSDMEALTQQINASARAAARTPDKQQLAKALRMIRNELFDFQQSAPFVSAVPVGRDTLKRVHSVAKQMARRNIIQRTLDDIMENADAYAAGQEAGMRNGIRNFVRSKFGKQVLNETERKALIEVANGRKPLQILSRFGFDLTKISGNATFLPTLGALGTYSMTGDVITPILLGSAGTAAKSLSPYLTNKAMQRTMAAIRGGKLPDPTVLQAMRQRQMLDQIRRTLLVTQQPAQRLVYPESSRSTQ